MRMLFILAAALCLAGAAAAQSVEFPYTAPLAEVRATAAPTPAPVRADMRTRDGVMLASDVWLPAGEGRWPVVLVRTPYLRASAADAFDAAYWTARGYAFVAQDVRGKGDSEGVFAPWENEARDGYDAIAWAAAQPWANGHVVTLGGSYLGAVQWAAASERPPALRAMAVLPAIADPFYGGAYDHGVFALAPYWPFENALRAPRAITTFDGENLAALPLDQLDTALFGEDVPLWNDYVARPQRSQWRAPRWPRDVCRVEAPSLVFMALWDGDSIGPALNWQTLQHCARARHAFVFGPWPHSMAQRGRRGDQEYGPGSQIDIMPIMDAWFEAHLRGDGGAATPAARVFVTGENRWRVFAHWPPRAQDVRLYLDARDARLSPQRPARRAMRDLRQGPDLGATRTLADATFSTSTILPAAPEDEQLAFLTAPFETHTVLGGAPRLRLTLRPGADDADVFAFLVAVSATGEMRALGQPGKLRLSYRGGMDARRALRPGRDVRFDMRLPDVAHAFAPGERLGLVLRAEWFPRWARNTGAGPLASATQTPNATHQILAGGGAQAHLTLSTLDSAR